MCYSKFSKLNFLFFFIVFIVDQSSGEENTLIMNDRTSLLSFMTRIRTDPENTLRSWNSSNVRVCEWEGVKCDPNGDRVTKLDLSRKSLIGTISPAISNLTSLEILDLSGNFFYGHIPPDLGRLSRLTQISLASNLLEGQVPAEFANFHSLVYLSLGSNRLEGRVPGSLFCNMSSSLQYLDLSNNSFAGPMPLSNQCELKELRFLLLWSNNFVGEFPKPLTNLSRLEWIDFESNLLTGALPSEIVNKMPNLKYLYLSYNNFISHDSNTNLKPFFSSLANSSNLQELEMAGNNIGGEIPSIIGNLSKNLVQFHLEENLLFGAIPPQISNLLNLTLLNLSSNFLNGSIPRQLCRMEKLERLYLSNNSLSGVIPSEFGHVLHLGLLDLSQNKLTGSIPDTFPNLSQLRRLFLYQNQLSGTIPPSLGKCNNLEILDLSHNEISGEIPSEVAGLSSLKLYLNLSSNHLEGPIPLELSKMDMVLAIDLSGNKLTGAIPSQLGSCIALERLNLSGNTLDGPLPASIGQLPYLKDLDLSMNRLTGEIPQSLQLSSTLKQLNLSFNDFHGNVSRKGKFSSLGIESFLGNNHLCGEIKGMRACKRKKRSTHIAIVLVLLSGFCMLLACIFSIKSGFKKDFIVYSDEEVGDCEQNQKKYPRISHKQLLEATKGFCSESLIGSGRFGRVYKGILRDNTEIAVKVLDPTTALEISGSFKRECQVLRRTRHRNLIRIITTCSRNEFKALVLPLMANGSLEDHLYPSHGLRRRLDLVEIVSICSDVAEGLAYLHHYSPVKVAHCDLKPSNILLDDDMTALITDFGIAKLVKGGDEGSDEHVEVSASSMDGLLCGSVGYIAPEYGLGKRASTQGDVYSFGVLVLEIVTGKRPTDVFFHEGSSLHEWVKSHYPNKLEPIIKEALERYAPSGQDQLFDDNLWQDMTVELIELGLICTQFHPSARPNMSDVAHEMARLKQYLADSPNFSLNKLVQK